MPAGKILIGLSSVTLVGLIVLYLYYKSQVKVMQGAEYNLQGASIFALGSPTPKPPTDSAGNPVITYTAPKYATDSRTEPANSIVEQTVDMFLKSANTMNKIKEDIGWNSNLFSGIDAQHVQKIKMAFVQKFNINPASLLSYPIWLPNQAPNLLPDLQKRSVISFGTIRGGVTGAATSPENFYNIPDWMNFVNYGFSQTDTNDFLALSRFYKNAIASILALQDAVRFEAVHVLRNQGWRFTDFGDVNN